MTFTFEVCPRCGDEEYHNYGNQEAAMEELRQCRIRFEREEAHKLFLLNKRKCFN